MFFQWRASKGGAEKFHSSLIQHAGQTGNRVWAEACELGSELGKLRAVAGSVLRPRVAIAFDWHSWWALELPAKPAEIPYVETVRRFHRWFYERNIPVDFVHPGGELDRFDLVVAPALYLLEATAAADLKRFVGDGGRLLTTYFTGIVDGNDQVYLGGYPGILRDLLGLTIEEFAPLPEGRRLGLAFEEGSFSCGRWSEVIHLREARALAAFEDGWIGGGPAITRNAWGKGAAFHLGTDPDDEGLDRLLRRVCEEAGVRPVLETPAEVEATLRESGDDRFLFLLNHRDEPVEVSLADFAGRDLVSGEAVGERLVLEALDVRVLQLEPRASSAP